MQKLGRDGWLKHTAPGDDPAEKIDVRTLALIRETLARHSGLADFAFAMQGLGAGPISLFGTTAQSAPMAAENRAAVRRSPRSRCPSRPPAPTSPILRPRRDANGNGYVLDGEKTWISNGGIADLYVVFARTGEAPGARGLVGVHRTRRQSRPVGRRTYRGDRAASSGAARVQELRGRRRRT